MAAKKTTKPPAAKRTAKGAAAAAAAQGGKGGAHAAPGGKGGKAAALALAPRCFTVQEALHVALGDQGIPHHLLAVHALEPLEGGKVQQAIRRLLQHERFRELHRRRRRQSRDHLVIYRLAARGIARHAGREGAHAVWQPGAGAYKTPCGIIKPTCKTQRLALQ